jgi:hypothetical protein
MNNRWSGIKVLCALMLVAGSRLAFAAAGDPIYVGAEKCKNCHSSPKKGDPFGKWAASFHSKAFTELASEEAKKLAKTKNIEDPQKSADCLKCHVTAFDLPATAKGKKFDPTMGVQCETCHGPGSKHVEARLKAEEAEDDKVVEIGKDEILAKVTSETCRKCHNKDAPNHKPFAFNKFLKQIAHLDPRKKRPADYLDTLPAEPTDEEGADKVEFRK